MAHGKRESILQNSRARDVQYWKKKGFLKKCFGVMSDKHYRAGVNKKTKRLTNHSERQQAKQYYSKTRIEDL